MKLPIFICAIALSVMSCNNAEPETPLVMAGAYSMTSLTMKTATTDTTSTSNHQMKIYTNEHLIYAWVNPPDSTAGFGIGTFDAAGDSVMEHISFTSGAAANDTLRHYTLKIQKTETGGYTQVIEEIGTGEDAMKLTETYDNVSSTATSPLDGAWKLKEVYSINGTDTTRSERIQFKVYFAGNVIWGNSFKDSTGATHTAVGYGSFEMNGNKVKENMKQSSFSAVRGNSFDLDIELMGTDGYKQSITNEDGIRSVEVFERMKK